MSELNLIKPAVRDVVAERILKARKDGVIERAIQKVERRKEKAEEKLLRSYQALAAILDAKFSFKFDRYESSPDELREYDRIARREAWKSVAWCVTIVPMFYFFIEMFDASFGDGVLDTGLGRSVSFLKHRKYFLRDVAERQKRLDEAKNQNTPA